LSQQDVDEVAYIPGDRVSLGIDPVVHGMHLVEITARFVEEVPVLQRPRKVHSLELTGVPEEKPDHRLIEEPDKVIRFSRVVLSAEIPPQINPGEYRCERLVGRTFGNQLLPFDPSTEATWSNWSFQVRAEPSTPLRFSTPLDEA
jgi:hypothetical protein